MKQLILTTLICSGLLAGPVFAQERTAGQANDAQVNWAALSAKLDALDTQNRAIAVSVATLQTSVNGINSKLDAIAACGAQQKVWTGSDCVAAAAALPTLQVANFTTPQFQTPASNLCQSKGYDVTIGTVALTTTQKLGGGRGGSELTSPAGYRTTCARIVSR